jgi:hypothetical protein
MALNTLTRGGDCDEIAEDFFSFLEEVERLCSWWFLAGDLVDRDGRLAMKVEAWEVQKIAGLSLASPAVGSSLANGSSLAARLTRFKSSC